jgi:hypothetical protein
MSDRKVKCAECDWGGVESVILTAPNPFDPSDTVNGCPKCHSVDSIVYACDEDGCWDDASCGTPTPAGYRSTCGKHRPDTYDAAKHASAYPGF